MKKVLILLIVVAMSVGAIFASGVKESDVKNSDNGQINLEWWTWDEDMQEKNKEIIAAYEATHPNCTVTNTIVSVNEYWTKLRIQANQNKLPDVFTMSAGSLEEWAENDLLLNLDSLIASDDTRDVFYDTLLDSAKQISGGEHNYALPFALVTFPLFYNKDAFDAAGIDYPTDDWTWDDFKMAAKALTIDENSDGIIDQWGFWFYGRYAHIEPWVYANDGYLIDRDTMRYNPDNNAMEAIKMLTDLVLVDKVSPQPKEMSAYRQQDVFPKGVAAMFIDGSWNINNNRLVADPSMNWGIAQVPKGPNANVGYTYGYPDSYSISPSTENPQEAWEFARFVSGEGLSLDSFMAGKIPSYRALAESAEFIDVNQKPAEMIILTQQAASPMRTSFTKGWGEWRGYAAAESLGFNGVIDGIINGELQFDEGMSDVTDSVNTVLKRYYK